MPNLPGEQLVNRHAGTEVRGALLQAHAGQEHSVATRVIPGAIGSGFSQFLVDAAQELAPAKLEMALGSEGLRDHKELLVTGCSLLVANSWFPIGAIIMAPS